ncbi:hypothetical protein [Phenylobacterium sp.]|uniref:hypothetical protein n=1 Tax=Phenylobacterium sp. TaxID=1871053 RepID=UPI0025CD8881|nr:hypothetical protein [Phenylobacterium sp.]
MPMFGKKSEMTEEERRRRREMIGAIISDVGSAIGGESGSQLSALQARRQQAMQQQQQADALNALMAQIQPDTMTPQVNELIGGANQRGAQVDMAPMGRMQPRPAFDFARPEARQAYVGAMQAGIDPKFALDISNSLTPKPPEMRLFNTRSGVVGIDPETGDAQSLYSDPYAEALAERQIAAQDALAGQRRAAGQAAMIRANRPPAPRAAKPAAPAPSVVDAPWLHFRR